MSGPVLVTGAAGFLGARFVESCNLRSIPVISVDTERYFAERTEHRGLDFGRIVDRDRLFAELDRDGSPTPAAIVHLGACTDTTELDEGYLRSVNLDDSQKLWRYATERRIPLSYASSAATYGAGELGQDDDEALIERLRPLNPYGESKRLFDLWVLEEERAGRTPPSWSGFKFFNVYGFGERHKGRMASVVLQAFDQIKSRGRVRLFRSHRQDVEDGYQARDFIWEGDVTEVLWFALDRPIERGIYNLGTGQARTFLDLVRAVFAALGVEPEVEFVDTPADIRERYQYFTEARMQRLRAAGFATPFTSLEDGVAQYVERLLAQEGSRQTR